MSAEKTLSKQQLQDKLRTDQEFHETLITEYNDVEKRIYSAHARPTVEDFCNASNFQEIPSESWKKFQEKFAKLTNEYESKIAACTESGFHGQFDEIDEARFGRTSPAIQYMHCYLKENPSLLTTTISLLPDGTFSESSSGAPTASNVRGRARAKSKGKRRGGGGRNDGGGATAAEGVFESIESKNRMIEQAQCMEMHHSMQERKRALKTEKRKAFNDFSERYGNKKTTKGIIKLYKETVAVRTEGDDDDESIEGITESQQELMEDYVEAEDAIGLLTEQITKNTAKLQRY